MSKYFIINEDKATLSKKQIEQVRKSKEKNLLMGYEKTKKETKKRLSKETIKLKHVDGRIIIKIDLDSKNTHTFESGVTIYRGRQFNNLNRRETEPVNCFVVDAEYIKSGSEILIHPNAIHDSNRIFDYSENITIEADNYVRYYSIEETSAFLYREKDEWKPLKGFATGLRVFKPYKGMLHGILPEKIKDVLYITSGELSCEVYQTLRACDYEITFQHTDGREKRIIRCRHYENECHDREEIIIKRNDLTEQVKNGELFIGLSPEDAKSILHK